MVQVFSPSALLWVAFGYLLGSCPTGYLLVKALTGEDIRRFGSGNIGATNVSRVLGKKWAIFTAVFDILKGGIAVLFAILCGVSSPSLLSAIGFAAVIGHDYPVWLKFDGGKGVATTYGVFACYDFFNPLPVIFGGLVWFAVREKTRYVSLASIVGLASSALFILFFMSDRAYFVSGTLLVLIAAWKHRQNIERLIHGTESKVNPILPGLVKKIRGKLSI